MIQNNGDIMNLSAAEFQPVFPIETNYAELSANSRLAPLKIEKFFSDGKIICIVTVPDDLHEINLLCLVNKKKYDMYFNVSAGNYKFTVTDSAALRKISLVYYNRIIRSEEQILHSV
ncbi:MAG: hypothetical protein AMXMBFR48_01360 [Ignavibacteriales bacterium]